MKILLVHLYNPDGGLGGAAKGVFELASALKKTNRYEIRAAVNAGPLAEHLRQENIRVFEIPRSKFQIPGLIRQLRRILRDFTPDIIHSHHRFTTFLLDLLFKRGNRILHTERVLKKNHRFFYRYGHRVTTVSESLRRHLIDYYRVPESLVRAIPNAAQLRFASARQVEDLKTHYPAAPGQLTGLCIGRFEEQKGHAYLMEAVAGLPPQDRLRLRIVLAGDGKLRAALEKKAQTLEVRGNFIFTGYTDAVPEWLEVCDFLILPSLWEGMPRSVIEAFYAGKPVIATAIEGTRDIVRDGENGLLVPPRSAQHLGQALLQVLNQPEKLKSWGASARQTGQKHSFAGMIQQYEQFYTELRISVRVEK